MAQDQMLRQIQERAVNGASAINALLAATGPLREALQACTDVNALVHEIISARSQISAAQEQARRALKQANEAKTEAAGWQQRWADRGAEIEHVRAENDRLAKEAQNNKATLITLRSAAVEVNAPRHLVAKFDAALGIS